MSNEKQRNLSVELRPQRLSEVLGQESLVKQLRQSLSKRTPMAIMFVGEPGAGKTTLAKILAVSVQCSHGEFGEPCETCLSNTPLFNIIEQNCASLGTIGDVRELLPNLDTYPSFGTYRVIILDEAQGLGPKAQDAFLIPAERKDDPNLYIFCTSDPTKIKDTIKRRCLVYAVPELKPVEVETLVANSIKAVGEDKDPAPLSAELLKAGIKSPGFIVSAVQKYLDGAPLAESILVKDAGSIDHYALVYACARGDWATCQALLGQATPADADGIKTKLSWRFRKILVESRNHTHLAFASEAIHELSTHNSSQIYEAGLQLSMLTASIYKICRMVQEHIAASISQKEAVAAMKSSAEFGTKQSTIQ